MILPVETTFFFFFTVKDTSPSFDSEGVDSKGEIAKSNGEDGDMNSDEGKFRILVRLQLFDGSFPLHIQLRKLIDLKMHEFSKERDEMK